MTLATEFESRSEEDTQQLGERLGARLVGGEVLFLCGDLGVGKTQFTKGVARGLGVSDEVVSPTFTLAVQYQGRMPIVHYDLYRVENESELREIGFLETDDPRTVSIVEWGDRTRIPDDAVRIDLRIDSDADQGPVRRIQMRGLPAGVTL